MQLNIQAREFVLTEALRNYTQKRLKFAVARDDNVVMRVRIRLARSEERRVGKECA